MTFLNRTLVMLPLLALLLAGCSTPPQTIKTPPDAVYLWTRAMKSILRSPGSRI